MATPDAGERNPGERLRDLEAMLDAITDYEIIKLDVDGNVASWSPGAEALTGYSAAEAIGRPASIFSSEEDQAAGLVEQELRTARETGRFELEGWRVRKGGEKFWASVVLAPIRDEGSALSGFVKVARDITELKRAESMFRDLLESAPDADPLLVELGLPGAQAAVHGLAVHLRGPLEVRPRRSRRSFLPGRRVAGDLRHLPSRLDRRPPPRSTHRP